MVLVTGNWRVWLAGMAASLIIFAVVFFTVIQPSQDTANQALKSGLQQTQQVLNQAQKDVNNAGGATSGASKVINNAQKLTACVAAAGTDVTKVQACQAKYAK